MMKTKCLLLFGLMCFFSSTAQQLQVPQLVSPAPASPTSASLGKFGEVPVSLSTGIPSISIPIYEIKSGNISLPVGLSYHAGGIKVEERASWVGLGWNLNAGGVITRVCHGLPDEIGSGFKVNGYKVIDFYNGTMNSSQKEAYLASIEGNGTDAEPDIFYYNFGTYSGKFFFDNDGSIISMPLNNLRITYLSQPQTGWQIVTPDGSTYNFTIAEVTRTTPYAYSGGSLEQGNPIEMETSWYLKQVKDVNDNTVDFLYEDEEYYFETHNQSTYQYVTSPSTSNCGTTGGSQGGSLYYSYSGVEIFGKRLLKASFSNGEVSFLPATSLRQDLATYALSKIQIKNNSVVLKEMDFNYDYFGTTGPINSRLKLNSVFEKGANGEEGGKYLFQYSQTQLPPINSYDEDHWGFFNAANNTTFVSYTLDDGTSAGANKTPNPFFTQAGMLKKITYPTGGYAEFEYENNDINKFVPAHYGPGVLFADLIGNNYGATQQNIYFSKQVTVSASDLSPEDNLAHFNISVGQSIDDNPNNYAYSISYSIYDQNNNWLYSGNDQSGVSQLNLGVGTYTLKIYIANDVPGTPEIYCGLYMHLKPYVPDGYISEISGGLRIKKISSFTSLNSTPQVKKFNYNVFGQNISSGTAGPLLNYSHVSLLEKIVDEGPPCCVVPVYYACSIRHFSSTSHYPLLTTAGSFVVYGNVTTTSDSEEDGKTESVFATFSDYMDDVDPVFPFRPPTSVEWRRGNLLKQTIYKKDIAGFKKVQETENEYQLSVYTNTKESVGLKLGRDHFTGGAIIPNPSVGRKWKTYNVYSELINLKSTRTKTYDEINPNKYLEIVTSYDYAASHYQPVKITTTNSLSGETELAIKYPNEMQSNSAPNIYNEMVNRGIIAPVIEQTLFRDGTDLIRSSRTNYDYWLNGSWATGGTTSKIFPRTIELKNSANNFEITDRYYVYDESGNVLSASKENDAKAIYFWGYNKKYPVAKIIGIDYTTASSYITQSVLDAATGNGDDASVRNHLANLRNIPGAFVTTYTYKPLVGITSETDLNGKTIYYEYDGFNRLSLIRDQDNNIVKKICYNYAGQAEDCAVAANTTPMWESTGQIRCKPCPSNNAYTTNMQQHEERDNNPNSTSYNTTRWVDNNMAGNCVASPAWQNTGTPVCQSNGSNNTGYVLQQQTDMNPCSPTYNQTQTITTYNSTQCPPAAGCTTANCSGDDKKCINGVCETGVWKVISSTRMSRGSTQWSCTYAYCFSDGTFSIYRQTVTSSSSCFIECL